jgi:diguanylate cyclase (GGDEF)-like protein
MHHDTKKDRIIYTVQFLLFVMLVSLVLLMVSRIERIQGNSKVVNYAGIIRGSTQRLVKLEISQQPSDELIVSIDEILTNLQTGVGDYQLNKLADDLYMQKLNQLSSAWDALKSEINKLRIYQTDQNVFLRMSEELYVLADEAVKAAENYAEGEAEKLRKLEAALIAIIVLMLLIVTRQIVTVLLTTKRNRELNEAAYIDASTGLPNRARCNQIINNKTEGGKQYACVMFDLNNLKQTNDYYGHNAGDQLIYGFAGILLSTASDKVFVGRYGGDEFIAILSDTNYNEVTSFINNIETKTSYYNGNKSSIPISVAHGYELETAYAGFSLLVLLMRADEKMYRNKEMMKSSQACIYDGKESNPL